MEGWKLYLRSLQVSIMNIYNRDSVTGSRRASWTTNLSARRSWSWSWSLEDKLVRWEVRNEV
jgi:hypothetical protein